MSLHRLVLATLTTTFVLLLWGGFVHVTESSLACPDWPLCFGEFFPEMKGKVAIEHGHRLLAATVGLLTIGIVVGSWRMKAQDIGLHRMAWFALFLVVFQGLLGGITVIYRLPTVVSTAHLTLGSFFFCVLIWLAFRTRPGPAGDPVLEVVRWAKIGTGFVFVQLVLGALVRHTGAGLVCNNDMWLCNGHWWPTLAHWDPIPLQMARLHMIHRGMAMVVTVVVVWIAVCSARRGKEMGRPDLARWALVGPVLVLAQVILGMFTVHSFISIPVVMAHLAGAELLLAHQWSLALFATGRRGASS